MVTQIGDNYSALLGGKAETASDVMMVNSELFTLFWNISTHIQDTQKAGREEFGMIPVPALPSMLQQHLGREAAAQAHDGTKRLQLHR